MLENKNVLKIISLIIAILLWVYVMGEVNPDTKEKISEMANNAESKPLYFPTLVVSAITRDEWELGIPPVPVNLLASNLRSVTMGRIVLNPCANAQERIAAQKGLFHKNDSNPIESSSFFCSICSLQQIVCQCL